MSTGWKCEYIEPPPIQRKKSPKYPAAPASLSIYRPPQYASENFQHNRSFHYFRSCVLQDLSGCFEVDFWERYVLQVSKAEPPVRHALLALSSLCESKASDGPVVSETPEMKFALMHYTKAIGLLANDLTSKQPSQEIVLVSCLIFVWFEFVRNNLDTALNHLQAGLHILEDVQSLATTSSIDASIPRLFTRLRLQARLHGSPTSSFNSNKAERQPVPRNILPAKFTSLFHARSCLDTITDSQYLFHRRLFDPKLSPCEVFHVASATEQHLLASARLQHLQRLQEWQTVLENTSSLCLSAADDTKATAGVLLLQLHHTAAYIMIKPVFEDSEMAFDDLIAHFEHLVSLAGRLICESALNWTNGKAISLDIGVIMPLFLVTLKCRHPAIRRQAISLLKKAPEREGIWLKAECLCHAEWKISTEERGHEALLAKGGRLPASVRISGERPKQAVIAGQPVTVLTFRRGCGAIEGEVINMSAAMGEVC